MVGNEDVLQEPWLGAKRLSEGSRKKQSRTLEKGAKLSILSSG